MKVTGLTRYVLKTRKEIRELKRQGYQLLPWSIHAEPAWNEKIIDVKIAGEGKYLFVKKETVTR